MIEEEEEGDELKPGMVKVHALLLHLNNTSVAFIDNVSTNSILTF